MKDQRLERMGTAPVFPLMMKMALPAMFSMVMQALYNVVDSMFVSHYHKTALTAVSLAFPMQLLMVSFAVGTAIGLNSLISRRLGEQRYDEASKAATYSILLGIATWIVFALTGLFFSKSIIGAYTDNPMVLTGGTQYLSCIYIFSVGVFIEINIEKTIQATGNMIFPMLFQLTGAIINIILDPIFIFTLDMGTLGAAIATVIGQMISMVFAVIVLSRQIQAIQIDFRYIRHFDFKIIRDIYAVGIPSIVMQSISSVMLLGMNGILAGISETYVDVLGVYFKLQSFIFMPVFGLNQGVMPMMGYNYGAKKGRRLMDTLKYGIYVAIVIMAVGVVLFQTIPEVLLNMFNAYPEMLEVGTAALHIISLCFVPAAVGIMFSTLFQAVGHGIRSMIVSLFRQLGIILPVAYVLSGIRPSMVWYAFPIAEGGAMVIAVIFFVTLYKKEIKKLPAAV